MTNIIIFASKSLTITDKFPNKNVNVKVSRNYLNHIYNYYAADEYDNSLGNTHLL